jgi:hypothetical protein
MGRACISRRNKARTNKLKRPTKASPVEVGKAREFDKQSGWSKFFSLLQDFDLAAPIQRNQPGWTRREKE